MAGIRIILGVMKYLLILLLAFALVAWLLQEKLIFMPQPISTYSAKNITPRFKSKQIEIPSDGEVLHGWVLPNDAAKIVLYFGGNAEEVSYNLNDFREHFDAKVYCMNYRGYGQSTGSPSEKGLFADALAIFDRAVADHPNHEVILIGRSLGSGVATYLASQRPCSRMVLVTPFDSLQSMASAHYPFLPVSLLLRHRFRSDLYVAEQTIPALILAGSSDQVIPRKHTEQLIESFPTKPQTVWVDRAGHNNIQSYPHYWDALTKFINH